MKSINLRILLPIFCVLCVMCIVPACDTENLLNLDSEMLDIDLESDSQTLNIGDTTTIKANVDYSANADVLVYEWNTNGGRIVGEGTSIVYIAPENTGTYTITLEVTDGKVTVRDEIRITVNIGHAIIASPNRYWQGNTFTQTLKYRLNVDEVFLDNIRLRYEILQETARTGAFLTISIDDTTIVRNRDIGEVQPDGPVLIADEVDVSSILQSSGVYELKLTLEIVNVMQDAWLLQKLTIIGVEGSLTEIR